MTGWSGMFLDPLIGRDDDLAALLQLMSRARLVTLTGTGGSGKTRLAQAAVANLRDAGREAWFVDCAAVTDARIVGATIVAALDLPGVQGLDPLDLVIATLKERQAVLALDNLEQIDDAGGIATHLLEACKDLSILATSRIPMRVRGEAEFPVPPLKLPTEATSAGVLASPAGTLFFTRSGPLAAADNLDESTAADIATLLRRLDGLPLAIELAAARMRAMSPREINRRLDERGTEAIDFGADDRHRSLRSIMDWTVSQLTPGEVETLEAVSVCAGFDVALAQALVPDRDVVPAIESLLALGLVDRAESVGPTTRFSLLQTIQSAMVRRVTPKVRKTNLDRLAAHFLDIAVYWEQAAITRPTRELTAALDADAVNLRRALDHLEAVDKRRGLVLLTRLEYFWSTHGRYREGYERFQRAIANASGPSIELARAASSQVLALGMAISHDQYRALIDRALRLARAVDDRATLEGALSLRAITAQDDRDVERLRAIAAEMESIAVDADQESQLRLLDVGSRLSNAVDGPASDRYIDLARTYVAALEGAGRDSAYLVSLGLAVSLIARGEHQAALQLARAAKATYLETGREGHASWAMALVSASLAELGRVEEAIDAAVEHVELALRLGLMRVTADALLSAIPTALAAGQPELAARLYGGLVQGMVVRGENWLTRAELDSIAGWLKRIERAAPKLAVKLAIRDGELADPVRLLESLPELLRRPASPAAAIGVLRHGALTRREVEVLILVGRGRSDTQIADELFISPKTASVHVSNVKGKLGVESRLEMALRARDLRLVEGTPQK